VTHAGTFNGHLAAAVAGAMTLRHLDEGAIARLNDSAAALAGRILAAAAAAGIPAEVTRAGSIMNVHLQGPGGRLGVEAERGFAASSPAGTVTYSAAAPSRSNSIRPKTSSPTATALTPPGHVNRRRT
jgi:glutamate-1-semialdehyde aminotransferase